MNFLKKFLNVLSHFSLINNPLGVDCTIPILEMKKVGFNDLSNSLILNLKSYLIPHSL